MADAKLTALTANSGPVAADLLYLVDDPAGTPLSQKLSFGASFQALWGLTPAADKLPYFTGSGTAGVVDFTAFGRSLIDDADAAAGRATLAAAGTGVANTFTAHNLSQITDAVTNATTIGLTLEHQSSGTPATFFGSSIKFLLESTTTVGQDAALIDARWATATHASRLAVLELSAYYIGTKTSLQIYPMTSGSYAKLVWGSNADQGLWRESNEQVISGASVGFKSFNGAAYVFSARVDGDTTAGNTRLLIYDVDNATIERVSVGAADSGGVGYKVLRIPN